MILTQNKSISFKSKLLNKKVLRDYQIETLESLNRELILNDKVVLAAAPSSGKTFMLIQFIKDNPGKTFLILSHGTEVIRDQWQEKLTEENLKFNLSEFGKQRITLGLPQGIRNRDIKKVDYLIVDEAHHFYKADMVKSIESTCNPEKVILLTGTPSRFIKDGYTIVAVPTEVLIQKEVVSDLYVGVATTSEIIKESDYNSDDELRSTYKFRNTEESLNNLIEAIEKRLVNSGFKDNPEVLRSVGWAAIPVGQTIDKLFRRLEKTMFACHSIKQAEEVFNYLQNKGTKVLLSTSENDVNSENFKKFKDPNLDYQVLIVVDRGILGFDFPELINVVDMTFSRNIDSIFQLYSRVLRKSMFHKKKYFFKLSIENEQSLMEFYMEAALCMMFQNFYLNYNGKNLDGMKIPVIIEKRQKNSNKKTGKQSKKIEEIHSIDKLFKDTVNAYSILNPILNKKGKSFNEFAFMTISEIKSRKKGINSGINPDERKRILLELAKNNQPRPSSKTKLGASLCGYTNINRDTWDFDFTRKLKKLRPDWFLLKDLKKQNLLNLAKSGKNRPSQKTQLGMTFQNYTLSHRSSYDFDFTQKIKKIRPDWFLKVNHFSNLKKEKIIEIAKKGENRPKQRQSQLGKALTQYTNNSNTYDPDFTAKLKKLRPDWFKK